MSADESKIYFTLRDPNFYNDIPIIADYFSDVGKKKIILDKHNKFCAAVEKTYPNAKKEDDYYFLSSDEFETIAKEIKERYICVRMLGES